MPAPLGRVVVGRDIDARSAPALTPRQAEIVRLLATGLPQKHVASVLGLSIKTVKNHMTMAYRRYSVTDLLELLISLGWLRIPAGFVGVDRRNWRRAVA